jgi:hypothetical protein
MPPPLPHPDRTRGVESPRHPRPARSVESLEHPPCHEDGRLGPFEIGQHPPVTPEQLRGDRAPRGFVVQPSKVHAVQARSVPRLHERTHRDRPLAHDDGKMGHIPVQPLEMIRRRQHPIPDEHHHV